MRLKHETRIKKNFHSKASHRLSEMFIKARKDGKKLKWMFDSVEGFVSQMEST